MSTVAGPGGGAAFVGASVAPPPISPPPESAPAALAALPSPDRELILSSVVAGVSIPNTVAASGVTPAAVRLAQQALTALQPAETTNGPPPATRERVVLLPHARTEPVGNPTRQSSPRRERAKGMNQDNSPRQPPPRGDDTARAIAANMQWHDAELAMKVARHSYESWLVAGHKDTRSSALMHAYHTHTALHEAARAISVLIETFRVEATMQATTPVPGTGVPTQRR